MSEETTSKFIGRWRHCDKLVFRCWPKWKLAYNAVLREKEIPINGIRIDENGRPELWHRKSMMNAYVFELSDEDFDVITAIPKAGAESGQMVVRAPGTDDERVKKECWLEVPVSIYPNAFRRKITPWGRIWNDKAPHIIHGETVEDALGLAGMMGVKTFFIERDKDIDENEILREVIENDAFIVLNQKKTSAKSVGVTTQAGRRLVEKAGYWVVPGRKPWEEGGVLRGYQFPDRIIRWKRRIDPKNKEKDLKEKLARMHESVKERGRVTRRKYFIENTVTRFAEKVGMSRQRVMAKFLDDGIIDWLLRSVDNIKPKAYREAPSLLNGRVSDAVRALEFYYRACERLNDDG